MCTEVDTVMDAIAIDREAFATWLEACGWDVVGYVRARNACPLARYLRRCGYGHAFVGTRTVRVNGRAYALPAWAQAFVAALDRCEPGTSICGRHAWGLLRDVPGAQ